MPTTRIDGTRGEIRIPELGVLVAEMKRPVLLRRRADDGSDTTEFDLHAAVFYWNDYLWSDPDWTKEFTVFIGKEPLKLTVLPTSKVIRDHQSLRIEGVKLG